VEADLRHIAAGGDLAAEVADLPWYHSIELPGGVVTPGFYDLRDLPAHLPIPDSLDGKRCLDVGSATGFWAFELERRGASEVISLDLDDSSRRDFQRPDRTSTERTAPSGLALPSFELARRELESSVRRVDGSVYDLTEADFGGFDFVFVGSLLLHLRDPIGALIACRRVTRGQLLSLEPVSAVLKLLRPRAPTAGLQTFKDNFWWHPNPAAHRHYLAAAGFELEASGADIRQRFGEGFSQPQFSLRERVKTRSLEDLYYRLVTLRRGVLSSWALGR
jgi:SAM-dependent methyltransferase